MNVFITRSISTHANTWYEAKCKEEISPRMTTGPMQVSVNRIRMFCTRDLDAVIVYVAVKDAITILDIT